MHEQHLRVKQRFNSALASLFTILGFYGKVARNSGINNNGVTSGVLVAVVTLNLDECRLLKHRFVLKVHEMNLQTVKAE